MNDLLPVHPRTGLRAVGIVGGRYVWPIMGGDENAEAEVTTRIDAIDERLTAVRAELLSFDGRDLDQDETTRFAALETEHGALETEREPLAARATLLGKVRRAVEAGAGFSGGNGPGTSGGRSPEYMRSVEPYGDLDRVRGNQLSASDLRSRALKAVELAPDEGMGDAGRERAEQLVRRDRRGAIARHVLMTGSDDYGRAFEMFLGGMQPWQMDDVQLRAMRFADEHRRAIGEGSTAAGGALVPFYLDPTIILTNDGSTNPMRQISRVVSITTNEWHGVTSAGVTAGYLGESTEASDDSPSDFAQPGVPTYKAAAYLSASFEAAQDTAIASDVAMLLQDARDNFEAAEFVLGTGSGSNHIHGVVPGVAAVSGSVIASKTAATFAIDDVWALADAVKPRYRKNAKWLAEYAIYSLIRQFATGSGQQAGSFWTDLNGDTPAKIAGRPIAEASHMASAVATNAEILLTGDFSRYLIVDRIGMQVAYNPLVVGANGRPTGEVGWFAHWRSGGDVLDANAFRLLKIS